jgi:hypothetical protein
MPSKPPLTLANTFTLIVHMQNTADPTVTWRNTWDINQSTATPSPSDAIFTAIQAFHQGNLRADANVEMMELRNWSQGPQPFSTRGFIWQKVIGPTAGAGDKTQPTPVGYGGEAAGNQQVPGSTVLFCKRFSGSGGKVSHLFLRGLLDAGDIAAETGGKPVFLPSPRVTQALFNAIVGNTLAPYFAPSSGPSLVNVHVGNKGAGPAFFSLVSSMAMIGPSQNKQTRKNKK